MQLQPLDVSAAFGLMPARFVEIHDLSQVVIEQSEGVVSVFRQYFQHEVPKTVEVIEAIENIHIERPNHFSIGFFFAAFFLLATREIYIYFRVRGLLKRHSFF